MSKRVSTADPDPLAPAESSLADASEMGWVGVIANRNSGTGRGLRLVDRLTRALRGVSLRTTVAWTPDERSALVSESAADPACRCLVAVGGDGTVAALINERPAVPLTVLPAGTENLVAQHFGFRRDPDALAAIIAGGQPVPVDVGLAGDRRFFAMAGFGFDGDVVTRHHHARLSHAGQIRRSHRFAYVEPILRASLAYRFPVITVKIADPGAGEVLSGTTVFVFNLPRYALRLPFAPQARDDDGWLDLVVFRDPGPFQALYYLWKVLRGNHFDEPGVFHRRVKKVVVTANQLIPVQLDGDPGGYIVPDNAAHAVLSPTSETMGDPDRPLARKRGLRLYGQSATAWTIEILPAAVDMFVAVDRPPRHNRLPLAGESARR